jgi:hypothetical protein
MWNLLLWNGKAFQWKSIAYICFPIVEFMIVMFSCFLHRVLRMKGFDPNWCDWIRNCVQGESVEIKVNDDIDHNFRTWKGSRQDDPLSPILFNIVADMLAVLIAWAKEEGHVGELLIHLVEGGLSILQYTDDTILFLQHDIEKFVNIKLIICIFEQMLGLKINFHKSNLFVLVKLRIWRNNMKKFLSVSPDLYHLGTMEYLFTIEFIVTRSATLLRAVFFQSEDARVANFSHMGIDSFWLIQYSQVF